MTNVMAEAYRKALDEDAVMGIGDASPVGDVSAPTPTTDTDIVKSSPGISRDDVLGKYDSEKGVFGNKDFNIPKNILGKGKTLKRFEIPSKKLKGHKNPYIKNMKIINEKTIDEFIESISECLNEEDSDKSMLNQLKELRKTMKNPEDLDNFMNSHQKEIEEFQNSNKLNSQQKGIFAKIWSSLKYAVSKGWQFVKKHWWKILLLVLIIAAIIWGGQTDRGIRWGTKLFGDGYGKVVDGAKVYGNNGLSKIKKLVSPAKDLATVASNALTINDLKKAKQWIPIDINDLPKGGFISVPMEDNPNIFWTHLKDGTRVFDLKGDGNYYKPIF